LPTLIAIGIGTCTVINGARCASHLAENAQLISRRRKMYSSLILI
jgi:hypothetical protein